MYCTGDLTEPCSTLCNLSLLCNCQFSILSLMMFTTFTISHFIKSFSLKTLKETISYSEFVRNFRISYGWPFCQIRTSVVQLPICVRKVAIVTSGNKASSAPLQLRRNICNEKDGQVPFGPIGRAWRCFP